MPSLGETPEGLVRRLCNRRAAGLALSIALHLLLIALVLLVRTPGANYAVKRGEPLFVELPEAPGQAPAGDPSARTPGPPERGQSPIVRAPVPPAPPAPRPAPRPAPTEAKPTPRPVPTPARPQPPAPREPSPAVARATPPPPEAKAADMPAPRPETAAPEAKAAAEAKAAPAETPSTAGGPAAGSRGQNPVDIRAALRPGGGGGGGGRGGGRAGIEGEPIPLDSTNPKYSDYLDRVRRMIKEKWTYPCVKKTDTRDCEYKSAQLMIEFGIAKDGKVPFVNVLRSSGFAIYDDVAVNAVKLASPFPPVPDSLSRTGFPIHATFNYIVDSGLTNLLR